MPRSKANQQQQQQQQQQAAAQTTVAATTTTTTPTTTTASNAAAVEPFQMTLFTRAKAGVNFISVKNDSDDAIDKCIKSDTRQFITPPIGGSFGDCESSLSPCGTYIAFADDQKVYVHSVEDGKRLFMIDAPRCIYLMWSPKSTFLVCYAHHDAVRSADNNLCVFRILGAATRKPIQDGVSKKQEPVLRCGQAFWPALSWTADENSCVRRSKTAVICVKGDLSDLSPISQLTTPLPSTVGKESSVAIPDSSSSSSSSSTTTTVLPPFVAVFTPQIKQQVAAIHVYRLPDLSNPVMTRPFGRGDRASIKFSPSGNQLTAVVSTDDDKSGSSYYGMTQCYLVDISNRSSEQITLATGEGIHDCKWSPVADEFVVVHGIMPRNKATLFNSRGQKIFSFSEEPRNVCYWSPSGQAIALGGNASMPGDYNFYSREAIAKVTNGGVGSLASAMSSVQLGKISQKSSHQMWLPDSRHFLTMNVFTTLRVDNRFTIWKYTGEKVAEEKFPEALFAVHCAVPQVKRDAMLKGSATNKGPWMRPYNSPVKDQSKVQQAAAAWKPRHQSAAAAALLASSAPRGSDASGSSNTVKPASTGPVGATVVVQKKKGGGRR